MVKSGGSAPGPPTPASNKNSLHFFKIASPLTENPGSAPVKCKLATLLALFFANDVLNSFFFVP